MALRAVVVGAGWAGEGHTVALRASGVEVVAVCGRSADPVRAMADRLGIRDARTDWRPALEELQPDLVAIATPAKAHHDIAVAASSIGCHVVCDKPLGNNAAEAAQMLAAAERAGVSHAYGATGRYAAPVVHARSLIADGLIGEVTDVEAVLHLGLPALMPYGWIHSLAEGGGMLHNVFTHSLQQVLYLTDGAVDSVAGWANPASGEVPVGARVHDFRHWAPMSPEESAAAEWRKTDADMSATVLATVRSATGQSVSMAWHGSASTMARHEASLAVYGTEGTLHLVGQPWVNRIEYGNLGTGVWEPIAVPDVNGSPSIEDPVQDGWNQLMQHFVDHIQSGGDATYPTFVDGWLANEVIDIARRQEGWTSVPSRPS
jgi:predicted dehydrogenase